MFRFWCAAGLLLVAGLCVPGLPGLLLFAVVLLAVSATAFLLATDDSNPRRYM